MNNKEIKKLPFWETIGRSFKYVFKNTDLIKAILPVIGVLVVVQIIFNFPMMCSVGLSNQCSNGMANDVHILITALAACGIIINYCRSIVCKADVDYTSRNFFKRLGFYFVASICLSVLIGIPTFAITVLGAVIGLNEIALQLLVYATFLGLGIFFAPILMVFPAISVDDYKIINWNKLYSLVKGNHGAVFWGQLLIMVPYWILYRTITELYLLINATGWVANFIFITMFIALAIMDACIKGAFFAHIYQYFKFYDKHN